MDRIYKDTGCQERRECRKVLVVGREDSFTASIMDYAVQLADRLGYDIIALNVDTDWYPAAYRAEFQQNFRKRANVAGKIFMQKAAQNGIHCEHMIRFGALGPTVEEVHHEVKRAEFVVTESEASKEEVTCDVTIPVFSVIPNRWEANGGEIMAGEYRSSKGKHAVQMAIYGLITAGIYAAVFMNSETVMRFFTKGGWYAALPIATVFVFSFVHGNFSNSVWSLLGIEAVRKDAARKTERKVVQEKKRAAKRPRVQAYVNPFHRI